MRSRGATQLRFSISTATDLAEPKLSDITPGRTRTSNPWFRRPLFYPGLFQDDKAATVYLTSAYVSSQACLRLLQFSIFYTKFNAVQWIPCRIPCHVISHLD